MMIGMVREGRVGPLQPRSAKNTTKDRRLPGRRYHTSLLRMRYVELQGDFTLETHAVHDGVISGAHGCLA